MKTLKIRYIITKKMNNSLRNNVYYSQKNNNLICNNVNL